MYTHDFEPQRREERQDKNFFFALLASLRLNFFVGGESNA